MATLRTDYDGDRMRTTTPCQCTDEGEACRHCKESKRRIAGLYRGATPDPVLLDIDLEPLESRMIADLGSHRFTPVSVTKPGRWQVIR